MALRAKSMIEVLNGVTTQWQNLLVGARLETIEFVENLDFGNVAK